MSRRPCVVPLVSGFGGPTSLASPERVGFSLCPLFRPHWEPSSQLPHRRRRRPPLLWSPPQSRLILEGDLKVCARPPSEPLFWTVYGEISDAASIPPKTDPPAGQALWEALSGVACATRVCVGRTACDGHVPVPECRSAGQAVLQEWCTGCGCSTEVRFALSVRGSPGGGCSESSAARPASWDANCEMRLGPSCGGRRGFAPVL